jgi:hypothetical protein
VAGGRTAGGVLPNSKNMEKAIVGR